jgi:anti-sigma regulatory factor (Ser/Thr protein kinase)
MIAASQLSLRCPAQSRYVMAARHALGEFVAAFQFERRFCEDVVTAAGEALANIVEHAYDSAAHGDRYLELRAEVDRKGRLELDVFDGGSFIERRPLPGRGFGFRIMRAVAAEFYIDTRDDGTRLRMTFEQKS